MKKFKAEIAKTLAIVFIVTIMCASGITASALDEFTEEPALITVPLVGSVPNDVYFLLNDIVIFNDTYLALGALYSETSTRYPVLMAADNEDMDVWRATYNLSRYGYEMYYTKDFIISLASADNGYDINFSKDGKVWYKASLPDGFVVRGFHDGCELLDRYCMFTAQRNGKNGMLVTDDFTEWTFIEDWPDVPEEHTISAYNLVQGVDDDWYIYSQFANKSRETAEDSYGITYFYKASGTPSAASDWEQIGEYDGLAYIYAIIDDNDDAVYDAAVIKDNYVYHTAKSNGSDWNDWTSEGLGDVVYDTRPNPARGVGAYTTWDYKEPISVFMRGFTITIDSGATFFKPQVYWGDKLIYPNDAPRFCSIGGFADFDGKPYDAGLFTDVNEDAWYGTAQQNVVRLAYELKIVDGKSGGLFDPAGAIKISEAIKMAAVVHNIYNGGTGEFEQGSPWYGVYVDYAVENGIIAADDFDDYDRNATRAEMAYIFANSIPDTEFGRINYSSSLPDVTEDTDYYESISLLFNAGVLTGSGATHMFYPDRDISRAEACAIIARVVLPMQRERVYMY
ncbi:MAG: S-layer homology domain-containing protein [Oscillospiraceae bacterium]|nr:S-layer homology domain-containing protein [Oscillospiraceae bacterium]